MIVAGPAIAPVRVFGHVILEDPKHAAASLDMKVRMALVEAELVDPAAVGFTFPEQVTLGWPQPKEDPE